MIGTVAVLGLLAFAWIGLDGRVWAPDGPLGTDGGVGRAADGPTPRSDVEVTADTAVATATTRCTDGRRSIACTTSVTLDLGQERLHDRDAAVGRRLVVEGGQVTVLDPDGTVRSVAQRDGATRWSLPTHGARALGPAVAGVVPVIDDEGVDLHALTDGRRTGRIPRVAAGEVATVGPWVLVSTSDRLGAWSVNGRPGWELPLARGDRVITDGVGISIVTSAPPPIPVPRATLAVRSANTGDARFVRSFDGRVVDVHRTDPAVIVVLSQPARLAILDRRGEPVRTIPIPDTPVRWTSLGPDGRTLTLVSTPGSVTRVTTIATDRPPPAGASVGRDLPRSFGAGHLVRAGDDLIGSLDHEGLLTVLDLQDPEATWVRRFAPDARVVRERPLTIVDRQGIHTLDPTTFPAAAAGPEPGDV